MDTVINALREVVGMPQFYDSNNQLDYGAVTEYAFACILVLVVVASIFKFVLNWSKN